MNTAVLPARSRAPLRATLIACALGLSLGVAQAADAPAAKKALVQKVLQLQQPGIEAIARLLVEQPIAPLVQQVSLIVQNRVPPEKREALQKELQADLKKYADAALPLVREKAVAAAPATIGAKLERDFSEDELKQLIAWLESPLARKYQMALPEFQKLLSEKLVGDARAGVEPRLKELNESLSKRLAAYAPPAAPSAPAKP